MRLPRVACGQRPVHRLEMWLVRTLTGLPVNDLVRTALYRPAFFGRPFLSLVHRVLRGRSGWTVAEREAFASFVARQNRCEF